MKLLRSGSALLAAVISLVASAQVKWLEETHNFGAFSETDGKVSCRMKFVNNTDKPVIVNQVHVTCGCTTLDFDKKPVAPGDTGYISVSYDPSGRPGRFEKKIYVDMNTTPSRYTLYIKGSVIGSPSTINERYPVEAGPLRLRTASAPFGEVTKGFSKSYFFEVYNVSTDSVSPQWRNLPPYISVGTSRPVVYPGENQSYTFMLASDKVPDYGLTIDSMTIVPRPSTHPDETYTVPLMVMVNEDFSHLTPGQMMNAPVIELSESRVNFGTVNRDVPEAERSVEIRNAGNDQLVIRRIYSADGGITATASATKIKHGKTALLTVTVKPAEIKGNVINARVVVISNDPNEPVSTIRIVGEIK